MGTINKFVIFMIVIWFLTLSLVLKGISFNNTMVSLEENITTEMEATKVNYSQCLIKIWEVNDISKAYSNDVLKISKSAWENLDSFSDQLMTWFNTKIIPELSPDLRKNVQSEIVSCRNAYLWKVEYDLKPLFKVYNTNLKTFPNSFINLFTKFEKKDFILPKLESVTKSFETWIDNKLNLE